MVSKEDFMWVWKDSSRESILNQFYYEHIVLRKEYEKQNELKKWLEDSIKTTEEDYKQTSTEGCRKTQKTIIAVLKTVLREMQELEQKKGGDE